MNLITILTILGIVIFLAINYKQVLLFMKTFFPVFIQKLPMALFTLWFVATLVFALSKMAGDDQIIAEGRIDEAILAERRAQLGLDDPLHIQYFKQLGPLLLLDSQPSRVNRNKTIRTVLTDHLPHSAKLGVRAIFLALLFGIPIGIIAAIYHNGFIDKFATLMALAGVSVPNFVIGSLIVYFLVRKLQLFQATEWTNPYALWIPAAALGAFPFAAILRLTRASMLEALREDYIRTARAKGLSSIKVIVKHALRNSLTSVVTYVGPVVAGILIGSLVIEKIFYIPGIGDMFVRSVSNRDTPLVLGISVFFCMLLIFMNILVDSLYPVLNPRLRK